MGNVMAKPRYGLTVEEARRAWTLGKVMAIWERKHRTCMGKASQLALLQGDWSPSDITTEDLVKELTKDPFRPSKVIGVKLEEPCPPVAIAKSPQIPSSTSADSTSSEATATAEQTTIPF